ncbi:hypothetical protein GCM10010862_09230 [Devosia nitrariae]|uniref:Uncharacterized protein n=1 Tax=Devosia nitrariae TaxID=2071872 RepID=A0ABQ5W0Q8_9HYPH|nr:hypothetical protein GCM10010862_09230 [Devosia nitrariae]
MRPLDKPCKFEQFLGTLRVPAGKGDISLTGLVPLVHILLVGDHIPLLADHLRLERNVEMLQVLATAQCKCDTNIWATFEKGCRLLARTLRQQEPEPTL